MIRSKLRFLACVLLLAISVGSLAEICEAQSFQYPPYGAWRGRMVSREGFGNSVRYRWGNGITPTGGAVLSTAITELAPAVIAFAGRGEESDTRNAAARNAREVTIDRQELAAAQRDANDLLARTARLLDPSFSYKATPPENQPMTPTANGNFDYGDDPWPAVEDNKK